MKCPGVSKCVFATQPPECVSTGDSAAGILDTVLAGLAFLAVQLFVFLLQLF